MPGLTIVPVAVGGALSRRALRNPVVNMYRDWDKRHFLAATFQMMFTVYRDPVNSIIFGEPLRGEAATHEDVLREMVRLLPCIHAEQQGMLD